MKEKAADIDDTPGELFRRGTNELSIWSDVDTSVTENPIVVTQVFVEVSYS